ncbi:MAG: FAD binding domain-containing protein [Candidatus Limnocylindrales bacterium]
MIPAQFDYVRPAAMHEALQILTDREGEAKVLSGGYSLLPLLKLRLASPTLLVDIQDLDGLDEVIETDDGLRIGGRATHRRIHESPAVQARHPLLVDAAGGIGDPQVRNWGTIGGSCAHADPSSDWPAVLIATRATIFLRSLSGERRVAARDFFLDTFQTAIEPTELLTEVLIPTAPKPSGEAYAKLERRAGDFATVGVAVTLSLGPDGRIAAAGIGLTAVAEAPFAAVKAEAALVGQELNEATFQATGIAAAAESRPGSDSHGPEEYKRAMVKEMVVRALRTAAARAQAQR